MSKKLGNSNGALFLHAGGLFVLFILWAVLIALKNSLGSWKIPLFIGLVFLTIVGLYWLNKNLLKRK